VSLWPALRREAVGAWRSVRYDLDTRRAAKLASAFTEEFHAAPDDSLSRRAIPLVGVALLLAGGVAGTFLAVSGGLSALGTDRELPAVHQPVAAPGGPPVATAAANGTGSGARALAPGQPGEPGQPGRHPKRSPQVNVGPVVAPTRTPQLESSTVATPTPTVSASPSPTPTPSQSPAGYP
jgi:hypothetical protein